MAGSRRNAAATASSAVVSATRTLAARIVGDTPATAAPGGRIAAKRDRIAAPSSRALALVASVADPTGGAPRALFRNGTSKSCAVAAGRTLGRRRARSPARGRRDMNDAMPGAVSSGTLSLVPRAEAAWTDPWRGAGNAFVAVMTPVMVPSLGIQPVGAVSRSEEHTSELQS